MNRVLLSMFAIAAAGFMPVASLAQTANLSANRVKPDFNAPRASQIIDCEKSGNTGNTVRISKSEKPQEGVRKTLENLANAYSYYAENSPYVFDSGSNAFFRVQRGPDEATKGNLYLIISTDKGATWSAPEKYYDAAAEGQARYPSVQVHNKNKSNKLSDLSYVFFAPTLRPKGSPSASFDGGVFGFKNGTGPADMFYYEKPEGNNPDNQKWSSTSSWASDQSKPIAYMAQTLLSQGPGGVSYGQYGQYGFIAINPDAIESQVPPQWGLSVFRPSTAVDRSYNDKPSIGVDNEGTIYVLFCNMFADDQNNRVPAVSKSTDGGKTWSDLMRMPVTVLSDYFAANAAVSSGIISYGTQGFQVLGKDNFSYIFRVTMTRNADTVNQIVEAYYANGSWGMRKVADYSGYVPSLIYESSTPGTDTSASSQLDNEIQYVRTDDGKLLVKYLDFETHSFAGADVNSSDIFVTARSVDGGSWGAPQNITNDAFFDKLSWIPSSLPDLNDIPMIEIRTITDIDPNTAAYMQAQRRIDKQQEIAQFSFSVTTVGVNEDLNKNSQIELFEPYPNPASNIVEIPFSVERPTETKIEIFTVLGEKVAELQNGLTATGFHAVAFNAESLAPGAYYYALSSGTSKITKMLSIAR